MTKENKDNTNPGSCSYLTFNTVDWVDIFIRPVYKQVITHALNYCIDQKHCTIYAWCLMSNHLHLLAKAKDGSGLALIEKEFKKITTNRILEAMDMEPDLRRDWMLERFAQSSTNLKRIERFQVWQSCSNPVFIDFKQVFKVQERVLYIHENPVRDRIVKNPEDYVYSSAGDYAGTKGLVNVKVINFEELRMSVLKNGKS